MSTAWKLQAMADSSGVSRTLQARDDGTVQGLAKALDATSQPFIGRAVSDLPAQRASCAGRRSDRPVSSTSQAFPGAASGYMDREVRLGYQLAQVSPVIELRVWL